MAQLAPAAEGKPDNSAVIAAAFERLLCRAPTAEEAQTCLMFVNQQQILFTNPSKLTAVATGPAATIPPSADAQQRALENLVHVLLNHNDFVTIR